MSCWNCATSHWHQLKHFLHFSSTREISPAFTSSFPSYPWFSTIRKVWLFNSNHEDVKPSVSIGIEFRVVRTRESGKAGGGKFETVLHSWVMVGHTPLLGPQCGGHWGRGWETFTQTRWGLCENCMGLRWRVSECLESSAGAAETDLIWRCRCLMSPDSVGSTQWEVPTRGLNNIRHVLLSPPTLNIRNLH